MNKSLGNRIVVGVAAMMVAISLAACGGSAPPAENKAAADELAATWSRPSTPATQQP
jgi:predicted small lipoprotein YifL